MVSAPLSIRHVVNLYEKNGKLKPILARINTFVRLTIYNELPRGLLFRAIHFESEVPGSILGAT